MTGEGWLVTVVNTVIVSILELVEMIHQDSYQKS